MIATMANAGGGHTGRIRWFRLMVWTLALTGLWPRLAELDVRVESDPNEGWNAVWADQIARGERIYFQPDSLLANNYPPLSFHLLAAFADPLLAGRWIALLSLLVTAASLGWIARRTGGDGWIVAGLLIAFMTAHHAGYVAMNDPQWLGHALMTLGLGVLVASQRRGPEITFAAALMLLAGLIKHSLLPLPMAVTAWLWWEDRRAFRWWFISAGIGLVLALGWMYWRHGPECLASIVGTPRGYSWPAGARSILRWAAVGLPLVLAAWSGCRRVTEARWRRLAQTYLLTSAIWAGLTIGGQGVDRNVYFDLIIAAVLASGWILAQEKDRLWPWCATAAVASIVIVMPARWQESGQLRAQASDWATDIDWLMHQPGPIAARQLGLVHWSKHPVAVENFLLGQRLTASKINAEQIVNADVRLWVLPPDQAWPLPPGTDRDAWLRTLVPLRTSPNCVFLIRASKSQGP